MLCLSAALVSVSSCAKMEKTNECRRFIDMANASLAAIEKAAPDRDGETDDIAKGYDELAAMYEKLAQDVGALNLAVPELGARAGRYQAMARDAAAAAKEVADGARKLDPATMKSGQARWKQVKDAESALVGEINEYCAAP